jgi:tryptophan-rich sensory protein
MSSPFGWFFGSAIGIIGFIISLALYFIPAIIAIARHHRNRLAIFLLNFFLGWTFIGWIAALIWAVVK